MGENKGCIKIVGSNRAEMGCERVHYSARITRSFKRQKEGNSQAGQATTRSQLSTMSVPDTDTDSDVALRRADTMPTMFPNTLHRPRKFKSISFRT